MHVVLESLLLLLVLNAWSDVAPRLQGVVGVAGGSDGVVGIVSATCPSAVGVLPTPVAPLCYLAAHAGHKPLYG